AELFAMTAVCLKAAEDAQRFDRRPLELAEGFCRQARRRVETLFHELWHNSDDTDAKIAARVLAGRYDFLEEGVLDPSIDGPWIAAPRPKAKAKAAAPS